MILTSRALDFPNNDSKMPDRKDKSSTDLLSSSLCPSPSNQPFLFSGLQSLVLLQLDSIIKSAAKELEAKTEPAATTVKESSSTSEAELEQRKPYSCWNPLLTEATTNLASGGFTNPSRALFDILLSPGFSLEGSSVDPEEFDQPVSASHCTTAASVSTTTVTTSAAPPSRIACVPAVNNVPATARPSDGRFEGLAVLNPDLPRTPRFLRTLPYASTATMSADSFQDPRVASDSKRPKMIVLSADELAPSPTTATLQSRGSEADNAVPSTILAASSGPNFPPASVADIAVPLTIGESSTSEVSQPSAAIGGARLPGAISWPEYNRLVELLLQHLASSGHGHKHD
jgi:hypothetical protein